MWLEILQQTMLFLLIGWMCYHELVEHRNDKEKTNH